ncbi:MAG TPA: LamG domain-containing protein, partial [Catenuloplanes sp.]
TVSATTGLVSQWRLDENSVSADTFTNATNGTVLSSHTGETDATWTRWAGDTITAFTTTTSPGTLRKSNVAGGVTYYASAVPPSADYQVEADVVVKSTAVASIGVVGRLSTSATGGGTYYLARYDKVTAAWQLLKVVNGTATVLGTAYAQTLAVGTYRLKLTLKGTSLALAVDGVDRVTATDAAIAAAGQAGVRLGAGSESTSYSDTTSYHLDNFRVTPPVTDSKGTNHGTYVAEPALGSPGALAGDANTAVTFNGTDEYATVARQVQDDYSVEFWFKSTQGLGTGTRWSDGAGLVDSETAGTWDEFGVSLRADGRIMAGTGRYGNGIYSISSAAGGYNDGAWHHVVFTRNRTTTAMVIYADGVAVATGNGATTSSTTTQTINFGRLASGTNYFAGSLDEIAVYNTALSAQTVADHFNQGSADVAGPTGGSVDATGLVGTGARYSTSTNLSIALAKGTDGGSGLAATGAQLRRSTATLTSAGTADGTCGTYNTSVQVGANDPTGPVADTVPAGQACYRYEYIVADTLGNTTTYFSGDIKVDTTTPTAPAFTFTAMTNTYWPGTGTTVYYRRAATSGSFTANATATDANSGIAGYAMPTLGTGWTTPSGTTGIQTYAWSSANPTAPVGGQSVTTTNNASLTSTAGFTLTTDATAPSGGSISYAGGFTSTGSVAVTFTAGGSDTGSGVNPTGGLLQRQSAILTSGTCGTFGSFATITGGTNPISPLSDTSVVAGNCYQYRYVTTDRVGNEDLTTVGANTVKATSYNAAVASTTGLVSQWRLGEATVASDTFTDATGALLSAHGGEIGTTTWTTVNSTRTAQVSATDTLRITSAGGNAVYYASAVPASADYMVEADVVLKGGLTSDDHIAGVVGRLDTAGTSTGTFYHARYNRLAAQWELRKTVNSAAVGNLTSATCSDFPQALTAGQSYRLGLDMKGSTIRMIVDGTVLCTATDSSITAKGRAGVRLYSATTPGDATGMHLDNFDVNHPVVDSYAANHGDYSYGPTLGVTGALAGDANTAATFNGSNEYATVTRQIQDDFSIEFWFKSTQGLSTSTNWWDGVGLVDAESAGNTNDFGVSLRSDGKVMAGVGKAGGDITIDS